MDRRSLLTATVAAVAAASLSRQVPGESQLTEWETWVLYQSAIPFDGEFTYHDDEEQLETVCYALAERGLLLRWTPEQLERCGESTDAIRFYASPAGKDLLRRMGLSTPVAVDGVYRRPPILPT